MGKTTNNQHVDIEKEQDETLKKIIYEAVLVAFKHDRSLALDRNYEPYKEKEAAKHLGVQPQTMAAWRHQGIRPKYIKVGSNVRYERIDLDACKEKKRVKTIY
ncbi:helix-turn-helix transcriptional regulator [Desulfosediminicola ganghwensis]|uniref:helix-turn-helix transcriptional regulator n=1 Tax=Desulfosediminicola ganghwensis TaxID=2569540 RepID=UPI0010ABD552|nr:helix-turn-helix domain-containing protein [Desulfosediminicola ganghwensis]